MAVAAVALASTSAQAAPILCPDPVQNPGARQFQVTVTPNAICRLTGTGNLNGNGDAVNNFGGQDVWTTLDKSDDGVFNPETAFSVTGDNTLNGTFQFSPEVWSHWGRIIVALKVGQGGS